MPTPLRNPSTPVAPIDQTNQVAPSPSVDATLDAIEAVATSFDDAVEADENYWRSHANDPKDEQRRLSRAVEHAIADIRERLARGDRSDATIVAVLRLGEHLGLFPFVDRIRGGEGPRAGGKTGGQTRGAAKTQEKDDKLQRIKRLAASYRAIYDSNDDEHDTAGMAKWIAPRVSLTLLTVRRHLRALGLE